MTGQHAEEFACAYCGTELEHGMDTIIRLEQFPDVVFCDRCEPIARRNAPGTTPSLEGIPVDEISPRTFQVSVAVAFAVSGIALAAAVLLILR